MRIDKTRMVPVDYRFLKSRIKEKGLTLSGVAAQMGWSASYLSREKIENRGGLKPRDLQFLAEILECEEEALKAPVPKPSEMPKEGKPTTAASLSDEELLQELMKRLLSRR